MPSFAVETAQRVYRNVVERGIIHRARDFVGQGAGKRFVVTTEDVWRLHGEKLRAQFDNGLEVLFSRAESE